MVPESKLKKIHTASRFLRSCSSEQKNQALQTAAELLIKNESAILKANAKDLKLLSPDASSSFRDRLTLTPTRIQHMSESLRQVATLPDPVGAETEKRKLNNGLILKKVRSPLGVIFMIFESRPNVAIEAFSMGFKSGNAMILRGGKESQKTVSILYKILNESLKKHKFPTEVLWGITDPDRKIVSHLLKQKDSIDVVVPRGGEKLIEFVIENSLIPIIKNDRGLCHTYVHLDADLDMALKILVNAKTQRPAVCNSMETILLHKDIAKKLLPRIYEAMSQFHVKWFVDRNCFALLKDHKDVKLAKEKNWNTEYLDQIVNCKLVDSAEDAINHIEQYGSHHSESIITQSEAVARKFQGEVDAAAVYWNASTRFTDGFEFGLGGELGISTQKLHVRGPVGLTALTSERWIIDGTGQIRQ